MSRYTDFVLDRWNAVEAQRQANGDQHTDHWIGVCRRLLESDARRQQKGQPEMFYTARADALQDLTDRDIEAGSDTYQVATDEEVNAWANEPEEDVDEAGL